MKNHRFRRLLSLVLVAALLAGFYVPGAEAATTTLTWKETDRQVTPDLTDRKFEANEEAPRNPSEIVRVSIVLEDKSTIQAGYSTSNIARNGAAIAYNNSLRAKQETLAKTISAEVLGGKALDVVWNLTLMANLISANVPYGKIEAISQVEGVKAVILETIYEPCVVERVDVAEPQMFASVNMTGSSMVWSSGYTGAGSRIAIIDTGTDTDHQSFDSGAFLYALEQNAKAAGVSYDTYVAGLDLLDAQEIASVLSYLNIYKMDRSLTAAKLYLNEKLPFAVNYVDSNSDRLYVDHESDYQSEHGSHVAGIATANRYIPSGTSYVDAMDAVSVVGSAPDAQLITMKVFGITGGPSDADYMAAIEDAIWLGCDAVNLSLGSGMAGEATSAYFTDLLEYMTQTDTVVVGSAGNSGSWADTTPYSYLYSDDVNLDTVGSPGSLYSFLAVASVENDGGNGLILEAAGHKALYSDTADGSFYGLPYLDKSADLSGTEYDFLFIDGLGKAEDYAGMDLKGKVVFCSRGEINFAEKANIAVSKGAIATIVYNNDSTGIFGMNMTGYNYTAPAVSIAKSDANSIRRGATKQTSSAGITYYTGKITISGTPTNYYANSEYLTMSSFSSWGVPGDLSIKPEITAPGGMIYSVYGQTPKGGGTDAYELMSGTSMAAPAITGMAALMAQFLRESGLAEQEGMNVRTLAQSLLMSTAVPLLEEDSGGHYYSILKQGAGLARVDLATRADSYILVDGQSDGKVKAELGEDPNRTGVYEFSFSINNLTDEALSYTLSADIFRQDAFEYMEGSGIDLLDTWTNDLPATATFTVNGKPVTAGTDLSAYDLNGDGTTNAQDADYLLEYLLGNAASLKGNGDVDGNGTVNTYDAHVLLTSLSTSGGVTVPANGSVTVDVRLELTASGRKLLDENYENGTYVEAFVYAESAASAEGVAGTRHSIPVLAFYGNWTDPRMFDHGTYLELMYQELDKAPYMYNLLGCGNTLTINYGDGNEYYFGGNPYLEDDRYLPERNALSSWNGSYLMAQYYTLIRNADTLQMLITNADTGEVYMQRELGSTNGAFYYVNAGSWYDIQRKISLYWEGTNANGQPLADGTRVNVTLLAGPEYYRNDDGTYNYDALGEGAYMTTPLVIDNTDPEAKSINLVDTTLTITALDNQYVAAAVLMNHSGTSVIAQDTPNQATANTLATVELNLAGVMGQNFLLVVYDYAGNYTTYDIQLDLPEIERPYFTVVDYPSGTYYGLDADGTSITLASSNRGSIMAAEFADGYVFEVSDGDSLYVASDDDLSDFRYLGELDPSSDYGITTFLDLAFSYADDTLYGLFYCDLNSEYLPYLCTIDMFDGTMTVLGELPADILCLAIDDAGNFYGVGYDSSSLYTFTTAQLESSYTMTYVGEVGSYSTNSASSLAWDHDADVLYWAYPNALLQVDPETAEPTLLHTNAYSMVGLYIRPETWGNRFATTDVITDVSVNPREAQTLVGQSIQLSALVYPWFASNTQVTWTSSNNAIATVSSNGVVTGVKNGTATITATSVLDPGKSASATVTITSLNKDLNCIIWDEEGYVWWSEFNTDTIPGYTKVAQVQDNAPMTTTAFGGGTMYAATLNTSQGISDLYTVDPQTFDLSHVGTSSIAYLDLAYGPGTGFLFGCYFGYVVLVDTETGDYIGAFPWSENIAGDIIGITYYGSQYNSNYGAMTDYFLILDNGGNVYLEAFLISDAASGYFYGPQNGYLTNIGDEVSPSYFQGFYYDGAYAYWTRFNENDDIVELIAWDCENTGKFYSLGYFPDTVWPVSGLYTDADINGTMALTGRVPEIASIRTTELLSTIPVMELPVARSTNPTGSTNAAAAEYEEENEQVVITVTPAEDAPNGLMTVTYDASQLELASVTGTTEAFAYQAVDGQVTVAFASASQLTADTTVATLTFNVLAGGESTITVTHQEAGNKNVSKTESLTVSTPVVDESTCDEGRHVPGLQFIDKETGYCAYCDAICHSNGTTVWAIESDGDMIIYGTGENGAGELDYYDWLWTKHKDKIVTLTVEEGVTDPIFNFDGCTNLNTVSLSNAITTIDKFAFAECPNLEQINIPTSLTYLGSGALRGCKKLTEIYLPATVEEIGSGVFAACSNLEILKVDESNPHYYTDEKGVLYDTDGNWLRAAPGKLSGSYTVSGSVWGILDAAFEGCAELTEVIISEGVEFISSNVFADCTALKSVTIPNSILEIAIYAFNGCTGLETITFAGNAPEMMAEAFVGVTATAYYPAGNETWTEDVMQDYGGNITWVPYGEEVYSAEWITISTSLSGNIGLNFYAALSENLVNDPDTFVRFTLCGKNIDVPMSAATISTSNGVKQYRFTCPITSKNMADTVTAQVMNGDTPIGNAKSMDVVTYCNWVIQNYSNNKKTVNLMKAMLNYGASAQLLFKYNTDNLANAALTEADKVLPQVDASKYAHTKAGSEEGIVVDSMTLMLDSETSIRIYFKLTGSKTIDQYTFRINGAEATPVPKDSMYYVEIPNISAHLLSEMYTVTVGGITVTYGALSYVNQVMNYPQATAETVNMAKALFAYYEAAMAYKG